MTNEERIKWVTTGQVKNKNTERGFLDSYYYSEDDEWVSFWWISAMFLVFLFIIVFVITFIGVGAYDNLVKTIEYGDTFWGIIGKAFHVLGLLWVFGNVMNYVVGPLVLVLRHAFSSPDKEEDVNSIKEKDVLPKKHPYKGEWAPIALMLSRLSIELRNKQSDGLSGKIRELLWFMYTEDKNQLHIVKRHLDNPEICDRLARYIVVTNERDTLTSLFSTTANRQESLQLFDAIPKLVGDIHADINKTDEERIKAAKDFILNAPDYNKMNDFERLEYKEVKDDE